MKYLYYLATITLLYSCKKESANADKNSQKNNIRIAAINSKKFLFDASKAQTAGNADWILDYDKAGGIKRFPTPAQSNITSNTFETYWTGGNSAWGIALAKLGHPVEQLPPGNAITYGNTRNAQDLMNYDVFIVVEPNIRYTGKEKTAILNFVKNGGGLFIISDHTRSDRNNDGYDSPAIWNDLMNNNTVSKNPFGFRFELNTFSQTSNNRLTNTSNPVLNGTAGSVTSIRYSAGASMTITNDSKANGLIWKANTTRNNSNIMVLQAQFEKGRIVAIGDSSPADDGTGNPNDNLFFGWNELNGAHNRLHINASLWLAKLQ